MNRVIAVVFVAWSSTVLAQSAGAQAEVLFRQGRVNGLRARAGLYVGIISRQDADGYRRNAISYSGQCITCSRSPAGTEAVTRAARPQRYQRRRDPRQRFRRCPCAAR